MTSALFTVRFILVSFFSQLDEHLHLYHILIWLASFLVLSMPNVIKYFMRALRAAQSGETFSSESNMTSGFSLL